MAMGRWCEDPYQFDLVQEEDCIKYILELRRESDNDVINKKIDQRERETSVGTI